MGKHHETLGVSPDATKDEIKKAFHKLSKKYHPDLNPGDKEIENKYKTISAAYTALESGDDGDDHEAKARAYAEQHFRNSGFEDMLAGIMQNGFVSDQFGMVGKTGQNVQVNFAIPVITLIKGGQIEFEAQIPTTTKSGFGYVPCHKTITIEPNTAIGTQFVFPGEGCKGLDNTTGNLIIVVNACQDGIYDVEGLNLIVRGKIPSLDAIIGRRKKFILPNGEEQEFDVPIGCQNNQVLIIKGKGLNGINNKVGNLVIVFELRTEILSDENRLKLEKFLETL